MGFPVLVFSQFWILHRSLQAKVCMLHSAELIKRGYGDFVHTIGQGDTAGISYP